MKDTSSSLDHLVAAGILTEAGLLWLQKVETALKDGNFLDLDDLLLYAARLFPKS